MECLLTIDEVARLLRVKRSTVYAWTHQKRIPFIKVGGAGLRFNEAEISKWIESSTVQAQSPGDPTREVRHCARRVSRSSDKAVRRIVATARKDVLGQ